MPVTRHDKFQEQNLVIRDIRKRETNDKNTGNVIKFLQVYFNYDHSNNGSSIRGNPSFELCIFNTPIGFIKEGFKLSSFSTVDITDPEVQNCVDIKERTQISGWLKRNDKVELDMGIKTCHVTTLDTVTIYDSPSEDAKEIGKPERDTVMIVDNQSDDGKWLLVKTGGRDGFFTKLYDSIAKIIYDNRAACGLASLAKLEDVKARMKSPMYWHRDKETGCFIEGKNPSTYLKHTYFAPQPARGDKPAMSERYVDFKIPGSDESLSLEVLLNSSLTFRPVVTLTNVYIGAGKITPQLYVGSAVVTDIKKIERVHQQQNTLDAYSQDKELVERLKKQLEATKDYTANHYNERDRSESSNSPSRFSSASAAPETEENTTDLEAMLSGGPVMETLTISKEDDDEEINIPGLPSL